MNRIYLIFVSVFFLSLCNVSCSSDGDPVLTGPGVVDSTTDDGDTILVLNHFMSGEFFTDFKGSSTNFISILLSDGLDFDSETQSFTSEGRYVLLEINSKMRPDYMPEPGVYSVCPEIGNITNTFDPGVLNCTDGYCYATSTYYAEVDEEGNEIFTPLTAGYVRIQLLSEGEYQILMNMQDEDGNPFMASYRGALPLIFIGYKYEPQTATDLNLRFTDVSRAECWGDFFHNGTSDMLIDFITSDGRYNLGLEIFAFPTDRTDLTEGSYAISTEAVPGSVKPGYFNGYDSLYPSYICRYDETGNIQTIWWLSDGVVVVRRDNDIYTFEIDAYSAFGSHIQASYEGALSISTEYAGYYKPAQNKKLPLFKRTFTKMR